jgi:hypothetical protein
MLKTIAKRANASAAALARHADIFHMTNVLDAVEWLEENKYSSPINSLSDPLRLTLPHCGRRSQRFQSVSKIGRSAPRQSHPYPDEFMYGLLRDLTRPAQYGSVDHRSSTKSTKFSMFFSARSLS